MVIFYPTQTITTSKPSLFYMSSRSSYRSIINLSVVDHIAPRDNAADHERKRGWLIRLDKNQMLLPPLPWRNGGLENPVQFNSVDFGFVEVAKPYLLVSNCDSKYYKLAVSLNLDFFCAVMLVRDGVLNLGKWSGRGGVQLSRVNPYDNDDDISCSRKFDDVIFYQGKFCAVSKSGKAAAMDCSFEWEVITFPVATSMWWKKEKMKNLVELLGELLLVERHGSNFVAKGCSVGDMLDIVKFKVYKLDRIRKQWIEIKEGSGLDDRILFVAEDCCFSVSRLPRMSRKLHIFLL